MLRPLEISLVTAHADPLSRVGMNAVVRADPINPAALDEGYAASPRDTSIRNGYGQTGLPGIKRVRFGYRTWFLQFPAKFT